MTKIAIRAAKGRAFVVPGARNEKGGAVVLRGDDTADVDENAPEVQRGLHDHDIEKVKAPAAPVHGVRE